VTRVTWRWANVPLPELYLGSACVGTLVDVVVPVRLPLPAWTRFLGAALVTSGVALIAWAVASAAETSVDEPRELVTTGAYAVSRNPMYVGWGAAVLGAAVLNRNPWLLIAWLHAARAVHGEVLEEERSLSARFGRSFEEYRIRRPRYLPPLASRILKRWRPIA
jgi:protein-S-isoprenylcysteine O-methyltransferase Ste14